jgi:sphingolipid delta-4 desaturase
MLDRWVLTNILIQMAFNLAVFSLLGFKPLMYMALSFFFSVGLHPLGARWIQEHYVLHAPQETYSYYGPLNLVAFNVGYHNEHHDLPSVPWNRLPRIRRAAPELYDSLQYHASWTKLLFRFLFDREISLFSRFVRDERGGIALDAEVKPDVELVERGEPA